MNRWDEIKCNTDCGRCNHKGTPSVSKGSKYCLQLRKEISSDKESDSLLTSVRSFFNMKGKMRTSGKITIFEGNKNEQT